MCKICPRTKQRMCGEEADIICESCGGWCERETIKDSFKEESND